MSEREMLELAAKAAGYEIEIDVSPSSAAIWRILLITKGRQGGIYKQEWNPLADDGAAFRLAIKVNLLVGFLEHETRVSVLGWNDWQLNELHAGDARVATRLAITRAAAEIGRNMP